MSTRLLAECRVNEKLVLKMSFLAKLRKAGREHIKGLYTNWHEGMEGDPRFLTEEELKKISTHEIKIPKSEIQKLKAFYEKQGKGDLFELGKVHVKPSRGKHFVCWAQPNLKTLEDVKKTIELWLRLNLNQVLQGEVDFNSVDQQEGEDDISIEISEI